MSDDQIMYNERDNRFEMTMPHELRAAQRRLSRRRGLSEAAWLRTLIAEAAARELGPGWMGEETETK